MELCPSGADGSPAEAAEELAAGAGGPGDSDDSGAEDEGGEDAPAPPPAPSCRLPPVATVWARPVGLRPGCCELEVQVPLGPPGGRGVLLSSPAPLLVLRDADAVAEVQGLLAHSGGAGGRLRGAWRGRVPRMASGSLHFMHVRMVHPDAPCSCFELARLPCLQGLRLPAAC